MDPTWQTLIDEGLLSEDALAAARGRVESGEMAIDSAVIEAMDLPPARWPRLLATLGRALALPLAPASFLERPEEAALANIPPELTERLGVLGVASTPSSLTVVVPPIPSALLSELARVVGLRRLEVFVAPELNVREALLRHLGLPPPLHLDALAARRREAGSVPPAEVPALPARRNNHGHPGSLAEPLAPGATDGPAGATLRKLRNARTQAELRDALASVASELLGMRLFLRLEGDTLAGAMCAGAPVDGAHLDALRVPADPRTLIGRALRDGHRHCGPARDLSLLPIYVRLERALPPEVLVEPLRRGEEIVGVLVADNGSRPLPEGIGDVTRRLAPACGGPLTRLERAAPGPAPPAAQPDPAPAPAAEPRRPTTGEMMEFRGTGPIPVVDTAWDDDLDPHDTHVSVVPRARRPLDLEDVLDVDWDSQDGEVDDAEETLEGAVVRGLQPIRAAASELLGASRPDEELEGPTRPLSIETLKRLAREAQQQGPPTVDGPPEDEEIDPMAHTGDFSDVLQGVRDELSSSAHRFRALAAKEPAAEPPPEPRRVVDATPRLRAGPPPTFTPAPTAPVAEPPSPEELADAVLALSTRDDGGRAARTLEEAGADALEPLLAAFPGQLRVDRYGETAGTTPVQQHSAVLAAIVRLGTPATDALLERLDHFSPEVRYYAVLCLGSIGAENHLAALAARLFDGDPTVRDAGVHVLRPHRDTPGFKAVVRVLCNALGGSRVSAARTAAEMLGRLAAFDGIPALVAQLTGKGPIADAVHRALVLITARDFGREGWLWTRWYEENRGRPREALLAEALRSDRRDLRVAAFRELSSAAGETHGYDPDASVEERGESANRWASWAEPDED